MSPIDRVIVTGASSGIGFDIARRFLQAGSRVVLNARDEAKLARACEALAAHRERLWCVAGAIGEQGTAQRLAEAAQRHMGGLDVLVNNAGIFAPGPFLESSAQQLEAFFTTNVKGTFLVTQALVPLLIAAGGGAVINVGSVLVEQPSLALPASAAMASKGAVHALTRSLAVELAPHKIRVNTLTPSIIRTPLIDDPDSLIGIHPLKRVGEVEDTSEAALYLARAGFITGTTHFVDGGYAHGR